MHCNAPIIYYMQSLVQANRVQDDELTQMASGKNYVSIFGKRHGRASSVDGRHFRGSNASAACGDEGGLDRFSYMAWKIFQVIVDLNLLGFGVVIDQDN